MQENLYFEENNNYIKLIKVGLETIKNNHNIDIYDLALYQETHELLFVKKNRLENNRINEILKKVSVLRNIPSDEEYIKNVKLDSNIFYSILKEASREYIVSNTQRYEGDDEEKEELLLSLSQKEKNEILLFLKEQNEIIQDNLLPKSDINNILGNFFIDLIFLLSEDNEIPYFNNLLKQYKYDFNDLIMFCIDDPKFYFNEINSKIIKQYCEVFGVQSLIKKYKDSKEPISNSEDIDKRKFDVLLFLLRICDQYQKIYTDEKIVNLDNNEIYIDLKKYNILNKNSSILKKNILVSIHERFEDLFKDKFYISLDYTSLKSKNGNEPEIVKSYDYLFFNSIKEGIDLNYCNNLETLIREAYLLVKVSDKNKNKTKNKI